MVETPAIVVAPPAAAVRRVQPEFDRAGTWVFEYPHPDPYLRDPVIYVKEGSNLDELFKQFPTRNFYRLSHVKDVLPIHLKRIR